MGQTLKERLWGLAAVLAIAATAILIWGPSLRHP